MGKTRLTIERLVVANNVERSVAPNVAKITGQVGKDLREIQDSVYAGNDHRDLHTGLFFFVVETRSHSPTSRISMMFSMHFIPSDQLGFLLSAGYFKW